MTTMMKIKNVFLLAAAMTIAWTVVACSSSEDEIEEQPTLGGGIKAQFTISVPTTVGNTTRQNATVVQNSGNFRGINFIKLYPSALSKSAFESATTKSIGENTALTELIIPSTKEKVSANSYIPNNRLIGESHSVVYGDVQLQLGTRLFLFYGQAIGEGKEYNATLESFSANDKFINGYLDFSSLIGNPTNVSGFKFTPVPITTTDKSEAKRTAILTYLNKIAGTTGWSATTNTGLQQLYRSFTSMKAGSSADLEAAVKDLYFALGYFSDDLAVAIKDNIKNATYTENSETKKYVEVVETNKTLTFNDVINGYPSDSDNLPDGAAVLSWGGSTFSYLTTATSISASTSTEPAYLTNSLTSYVYPAPLYYWGHSEILTSEESQIDLFKDTEKKWDEIATATNFSNGNVITSKTRSIVLTDPVQYAVGRLDISVSASGGSAALLTDAGIGSNAQTVSADKLKLTGVLIGGQKEVDWKFEPTGTTEYTIYDNIEISQDESDGVAIQENHNKVLNHTLVLESTGKVGNDGDVVNVALEFVNNDKDFLGADGIIPKGTKFYLVGALKAEDYKDKSENGYNGYNQTGGKVFKQDFVTRADFTIVSLKQAINTIPDLRNPKVEFGLSVNLEWQKGITFEHRFE